MGEIVNLTEEGIVYVKFKKEMNEENVSIFLNELNEYLFSFKKKNKQARVFTDVSEMTELTSESRRKIADSIKENRDVIYKSTIYGFNSAIKQAMVSMILTFSGRHDIKLFNEKDKALRWIIED